MSVVLVFCAGRGGAGKTTLAVQAALSYARSGQRTVLVDAALGLASVDLFVGISSLRDLADVLHGRCTPEEALVPGPEGLSVLVGTSGSPELADLDASGVSRLRAVIAELAATHDVVVVDTATGLHAAALAPVLLATRLLLVLAPDPPGIVGCYAVARAIAVMRPDLLIEVVANLVEVEREGRDAFWRLRQALLDGLSVEARLVATVPRDSLVRDALALQSPLPPAPGGRGATAAFARFEVALCGDAQETRSGEGAQVIPLRQASARSAAPLTLISSDQKE